MQYHEATSNLVCKACKGKISTGDWYAEDNGKTYHLDCAELGHEDSKEFSEFEESDKEVRRRQRREEREAKSRLLGWE